MGSFLKNTAATVLGLMIFFGLSIGGLVTLLVLSASQDSGPAVRDRSILVVDLNQPIVESPQDSDTRTVLNDALSGDLKDSLTLRNAIGAIDAAADDKQIVGIYIAGDRQGDNLLGYAGLKEIRGALERFKAKGKQIFAYDVDWKEREYYLGSVANQVALNPAGSFEFNGLSSESPFFAGALQKFGVGVQVTRVGKYKSAVEPWLQTKRSPESRTQTGELLQDLWQEVLNTTAQARNKEVKQLQALADKQGALLPQEAQQAGLVDRLAYFDEMIIDLRKLTQTPEDEKAFRQVSLTAYAESLPEKSRSQDRIAVVYAEGDIVDGMGGPGDIGGDRLARQLRQLRQDDKVKAVVLRVNSPGGSATASELIQREMRLLREQAKKPVVVSMGSVAASGGYWIATYSDRIFAQPNTITGSIGVFGIRPNFQAIANNNGITWDVVKVGKYADSQTLTRPKSPEELAQYQKSVDQIYDQFLSKVAESRKLDKKQVNEIAQGRVWSGHKAKTIGLVDELGGLEAAIQDAAKRAKLEKWSVEEYPKPKPFDPAVFAKLLGVSSGETGKTPNLVKQELAKVQTELTILTKLNDPKQIYLRLPFNFRID
jgi:protease IV